MGADKRGTVKQVGAAPPPLGVLFIARYPKGLYDFVVGINRWAIRLRAYASLMGDVYPPFRLDMGPGEPGLPAAPESA